LSGKFFPPSGFRNFRKSGAYDGKVKGPVWDDTIIETDKKGKAQARLESLVSWGEKNNRPEISNEHAAHRHDIVVLATIHGTIPFTTGFMTP
jgi:hypothetical protein